MVPPSSHRVSRVRRYSGSSLLQFAFYIRDSHSVSSAFPCRSAKLLPLDVSPNPKSIKNLVWPLPRSLATTSGISVDFFSSPYLDVSVQAVPLINLLIQLMMYRLDSVRIAPFGHLRIVSCLPIPAAFRSLPRPSSAPNAKASSLRSY